MSRGAALLFRLIGPVITVFVVVVTAYTSPRPALEGEGLGVLLALVVFGVSAVAVLSLPRRRYHTSRLVFIPLFTWLASSLALVVLQPDGQGWLATFVVLGILAVRLPARFAPGLYLVGAAGLATSMALADASAVSIVLTLLGASIFILLSIAVVRLRESYGEQQRLIEELEESRAAQAQAAALAERGRLARDMHDVLAHSLSGLLLQLEGARMLASRADDPQTVEAIDRAHRLARTGLDEARRAIGMLRDDDLPGPERLPALAAEFERDAGIHVTLDVTGSERELASEARLALFRTAQEALTNARKHAHPSQIDVRLAYEPDGTRLVVEDLGREGGTNGALAASGSGYGLTGMRERAELIGGTLDAARTRDGFRVELWVPA